MAKPRQRGIEISTSQAFARARALRPLRGRIFLTHIGLIAERATKAFWPLWSWGFVLWTVMAFGLLENASIETTYVAALFGAGLALAFLVQGLRTFRWPHHLEAVDRLDRALEGRPISTLWDHQAIGARDQASVDIWRAHLDLMAERAARARAVEPDLRISDQDPLGLRYVAATGAVLALLFSTGSLGSKPANGLDPEVALLPSGPVFEGWIAPPAYTGLPTLYLNDVPTAAPVKVPQGSAVTIRLYGEDQTYGVIQSVTEAQNAAPETPSLDFEIARSGQIEIVEKGQPLKVWTFDVIPDTAPVIALAGPVNRTPAGEAEIDFEAADDYGVVAAEARIRLDLDQLERIHGLALDPEPVADIVFDLPMPFNGKTTEFNDSVVENLSKHPWAGLPVLLSLSALDARDQTGSSEDEAVLLPGRRFFDPLAAAIVEQRRDLMWNRQNARRITQVLRAVTLYPEDIFDSERAYLHLRTTIRRLESSLDQPLSDAARDEFAETLWKIALLIEDGNLADAAERLRRAQERLSEALKNGATEDEVAELMDELRKAMRDYLEQLAQESEQNPDRQQAQNGENREITENQLQQMLERIEELFREGRNQEAQELLEQLQRMMENMQAARREQGEGNQGQQSMRELSDTMRQQQDLSDDSFRQLQEQFNAERQPGQSPNAGRPGQGDRDDPSAEQGLMSPEALAERQEQLRDLLESQREALPGPEGEEGRAAREALRQAERDMGEARDALRRGDLPGALDEQAEALDRLREGLESLGREMARDQNPNAGRQGDQAGSPDPESEEDPLGRQSGTMGRLGTREKLLNGTDQYMRSREVLDEIRRRSGDKSRPKIELDYLQRLLDRF